MEFLYKLYSNDYFGIGLFIVITILAFSFLVILFFGKKDEKARNKQIANNTKVDNIEINNETTSKSEEIQTNALETISLSTENIPVIEETVPNLIEEPVLNVVDTGNMVINDETEPVINEEVVDPFVSSNIVLNSDLVTTEPFIDPVIEETKDEIQTPINNDNDMFNIPSLDDAFNQELNFSDEPANVEENKEEPILEFNIETPVIEEPVVNNIFTEPVEEEAPKKVVMPTQFSSVYLTKEKEEEVVEPEKSEKVEETVAPIPLKPEFDLPKPLDLPKLNKGSGVTSSNDSIINPVLNESNENNLSNIFGNIEEESYTIEK